MIAYVFPGQGAQYPGMASEFIEGSDIANRVFSQAKEILGFDIADIMINGTSEDLKQTKVTQPAIFLHSVIKAQLAGENFKPDCVAGHSLGEFSALTAAGALSFEEGLNLVSQRAIAMQHACEIQESTMAAILGLEDQIVENLCDSINEIVVPANYNCPGQLVISGSIEGIKKAIEKCTEAGARRALVLNVGGAFHSPLMEPAREELASAIEKSKFNIPKCSIYQNVDGLPQNDPEVIKENLVKQLTSPVKWTQTMLNMINNGVESFVEVGGNGKVLTGLIKKVDRKIPCSAL